MANGTCDYECKPHIGADGFWYVGSEFTNVRAVGTDGITPNIGVDGYWYIWDKNMGVKAVGEKGEKGEKGDKGDQGEPGKAGLQGPQGVSGPQGFTGPKGDTGIPGPQGPQGLQGAKGDVGVLGPKGDRGDKGETGATGIQGAKGDKGDTGMKGQTGPQGPAGPVNIADNLTTEDKAFALGAGQGKILMDSIDKVSKELGYESGKSGYTHYKKYNDGTLVMWGIVNVPYTNGYGTINFPVSFISDNDYSLFAQPKYVSSAYPFEVLVAQKMTGSFGNIYSRSFPSGNKNETHDVDWFAIGSWK